MIQKVRRLRELVKALRGALTQIFLFLLELLGCALTIYLVLCNFMGSL